MKAGNFLLILLVASALAGYAAWARRARERPAPPPPASVAFDAAIPLADRAEAERLWSRDGTLFVDVRSGIDYQFGHVAGAVSLPWEEVEERLPELKPRLEGAAALVVYCKSTDCGKSLWAAMRLRQEGLGQTRIYPGGWNEWSNHGLPAVRAER